MNHLFSIGDISNIFNIPVSTLRYYNEIGLFKPIQTDPRTGYRYYSTEQFEQLSLIKYLKQVGVSLKEIKDIYEKINPNNYVQLLKKQRSKALQEYRKLQILINKFTYRINEIEEARQCKDLDTIRVKTFPVRNILCHHERIASRPELERSIRKLEKMAMAYIDKVGLTIALDDLIKGNFNEYNSIFVMPEDSFDPEQTGMITTLAAGEYACIYYRGKHNESSPYYEKLLDYIENHNYEICGDSVRLIIIDRIISRERESYLAEIQIPIIEKSKKLNPGS